MEELLLYLIVGTLLAIGCLIWSILKLIWQFLLWIVEPIWEEIAFRWMLWEEREKERKIIAAHNDAVQEIDQTVAHFERLHARADAQSDHEPGRRQSG